MDGGLPFRLLGLDPAGATVTGPSDVLASRYDVTGLLTGAVSVAATAYADYAVACGRARPAVAVDTQRAAAAGQSLSFVRLEGRALAESAPLTGLVHARKGWVRLHANYDHHRDALCAVLGVEPQRAAVERAAADWDAIALETALAEHGGVGMAVRTVEQWAESDQGRVVANQPLLSVAVRGEGPHAPRQPRVLDLTRVVAGPVGTRMLGLLGADVLRLDRPDRPEQDIYLDTGLAKRSALVDLRTEDVHELLAQSDVVVIGYRPGALPGVRAAIEQHPQLVVIELSAWGWAGPWRTWRGFDSLVQAATGINVAEGSIGQPSQLPCQALDHATGYLIAACAWHGLTHRSADGLGRRYRLALAQTAAWLGIPRAEPCTATTVLADLQTISSGYGRSTVLAPPITINGTVPRWPSGAQRPGSALARWR